MPNVKAGLDEAVPSEQSSDGSLEGSVEGPAEAERAVAQDLARAISQRQFELRYLPEVSPASGAVLGVEATLLWNHPRHGLVAAEEFLLFFAAAEETYSVTLWATRKACEQLRAWRSNPERAAWTLSVKADAAIIQHPEFARDIIAILSSTGVDAAKLRIEMTERVLLQDPTAANAQIETLHNQGCRVGFDNFGHGYAGLGFLKSMPFNYFKVGDSFMSDPISDGDQAFVSTISSLGKSLGVEVIVKGVATEAQRSFCQAHEFDRAQGPLFGPPITIFE